MRTTGSLIWMLVLNTAYGFCRFRTATLRRDVPIAWPTERHRRHASRHTSRTKLHMQQYDISKPVFDLYAFRNIRGDALAKYNSLNQSEPLRINLYALGVLAFLSLPTLSTDVNGVPLTLPQTGAAALGAVGSAIFFLRECQRRSKQLTRLEKELAARDLQLRPPSSILADRPFGDAMSIREIQEYGGGPRILAVYGDSASELQKVLAVLRVYGKRLTQANVLVVPIVKRGSLTTERFEWLAAPEDMKEWISYFDLLSNDTIDNSAPAAASAFKWFGLSSTGRSFGSGAGDPPSWLQLFGQHLRPLDIVDPEDDPVDASTSEDAKAVMVQQQTFYDALTNGKLEQLETVFAKNETQQVSDVMSQGGRLDSWKFCLEDGARPEGMQIGNTEVVVESERKAFSTCIEYPVADGLADARLLAVQQWERSDSSSVWKMVQHQTIPWTTDVAAAGTLICDCRGCVSLVRGNPRRTFGGLIG